MEGKEIANAFNASGLSVDYPYHICIRPKGGNIAYQLEGKGENTMFIIFCMENNQEESLNRSLDYNLKYGGNNNNIKKRI